MEINNRKANYDYYIDDTYEAGIVLKGTEIKSIRQGSVDLKDSYGIIKKDEVYLLNMYIAKYEEGNRFNHDERRTRKLLLNKTEISKINSKVTLEGWTIVPMKLYLKKGKAKVLIGIGKGKKTYDKRETIKKRDLEREQRKELKYNKY
ncbi:MAG: SsrA-binding protein SmpB [Bacilli bacterium]|jgi:SsrA-binding protein|nr:SsrA-binding protein SmpB [Bacilli bacterium]